MTQAALFRPVLIRASAGSGKTFSLSNRFIALIAHGEKPERILATTFTKKAAGEILERVYQRLAAASLDAKAAKELGAFIAFPSFSPKDAQQVLARLVESQPRLNVCTLDSFFVAIAQSFSFELGMTPGWSLSDTDSDARIARAAIEALYRRADPAQIASLLSLLNKGDAKTTVHQQLERQIATLYAAAANTGQEEWSWIKVPNGLTAEQLLAVEEAIQRLEVPQTQAGKPDTNWKNAFQNALSALREKDWDFFLEQGITSKLLAGETTFYKRPIESAVQLAFAPLLGHLRAYFLGRLRHQNEASFSLARLFAQEFDELRRSEQTLDFTAVKRAIAAAQIAGQLSEMYYRLDSRIAHVLLDEFQDTSRDEWLILEPLLSEILSKAGGDNSFFCVGDTKQAIYGWRGGVAEVFDTLENTYPLLRESVERRDESRRSAPEIIETVNRVFAAVPEAPCLTEFPDVREHWSTRFTKHSTALLTSPGYAELRAIPVGEDADSATEITEHAAAIVAEVQTARPDVSIAVLLRRNKSVTPVIEALWRRGIRASGEAGNPLTDSWFVCLFLAAIKLSEHPGDSVSAFLLCNSPLGAYLDFTTFRDQAAAEALGLRIREEIAAHGLGEVFRNWFVALRPVLPAHDARRLNQLCERAYQYKIERSRRLSEFCSWIEKTPVENTSASPVRVMTFHKSKGLEFDVVILPELEDRIPNIQADRILSFQKDPMSLPTRITRYAEKGVRALDPKLAEMYEQVRSREVEEALAVLYVGLTRARFGLFMLIGEKEQRALSFGRILRETLVSTDAKQGILFSDGSPDFLTRIPKKTPRDSSKRQSSRQIAKLAKSAGKRRGVLRPLSSEIHAEGKVDLAALLQLQSEEHFLATTAVKGYLQQIEWLDASDTPPLLVQRLTSAIPQADARPYVERYLNSLGADGLQRLFTKSSRAGETQQLSRNLTVAFRHKQAIITTVLDRLVVTEKSGKAITAKLIQYRTDLDGKHETTARRNLASLLKEAVAQFTGVDKASITVVLVSLENAACEEF